MKYSIKFYKGCRTLERADEIIIKYDKKSAGLLDFVQKWNEDQRIIVDITELEDIESNLDIFAAAAGIHPEFAVMLHSTQNYEPIAALKLPFFFIDGVNCYDDLVGQITLGVSDVYILNELCFNLDEISKYCHENKVQIRVYPNVAQSASNFAVDEFKKFFIRPDDISFYEEYIDVIEFFGPLDKQPVLYDIYTDERWIGNLNDVILGLTKEIDNKTVVPYFGEARQKCRKRCIFGRCDICGSVEALAATLKDKELGLIKSKAKHIENENAETVEET